MALTQAFMDELEAHFDGLEAQADQAAVDDATEDCQLLIEMIKVKHRHVVKATAGVGVDTEDAGIRSEFDVKYPA
jgi:hypothetical protein